jgi:tRNA pseudouridine55 synthase
MIDLQKISEGSMLMINKPYRWTSFDVVKKLRGALGVKKIGHAGTLDPLATGLLILCTGKMTKQINDYQLMEKEYHGTLVLGKTTPSVDLETDFDSEQDISGLSCNQINAATTNFTGVIQQVPPSFSAVKVDGQRVYNKARKGQPVEIKPREVEIRSFEITFCELPQVEFKVICSKGTYIRSLVRDFGETLGCGAYLSSLVRTRIGKYALSNAYNLTDLVDEISSVNK